MPDNDEVSYKDYYLRTIIKQKENEFAGFKPVVGPTGMGKTSRIPQVLTEIREMGIDKRCIYTSHRHLLIEEMEAELKDRGIPSVYLKSNEDVVRAFIKDKDRNEFLESLEVYNFFEDYTDVSLRETKRLMQQIEKTIQSLNSISGEETIAAGLVHKQLKTQCSDLLKIFKNGLSNIALDKKESLLLYFPVSEM